MTREDQDKLWNELSEETRKEIQDNWQNIQKAKATNDLSTYGVGKQDVYKELFGEHNLQPKLTYENVTRELFKEGAWQPHDYASKYNFDKNAASTYFLNCTSERQADKLLAINQLLNVAKFLNKNKDGSDWVPDFNNESHPKWYLYIDYQSDEKGKIIIDWKNYIWSEVVYFRTEALAKQAVEILGEETIRTALGNY